MIEESGSVSLTNGSESGSRRPKNIWIRRIRIRYTAWPWYAKCSPSNAAGKKQSSETNHIKPVLRIRIRIQIRIHRIQMFLGLLDPAPFPDPSIIKQKNSKKNLNFLLSCDFFLTFIFEKWCKSTFKSNMLKFIFLIGFFLASWRSMMKT